MHTPLPQRVKSYRPIEPIAPPDVGCCSKIGHGFASQRNDAMGHKQTCVLADWERLAAFDWNLSHSLGYKVAVICSPAANQQ